MRKIFADYLRVVSLFIVTTICAAGAFAQDVSDEQTNSLTEETVGAVKQTDAVSDTKNEFSFWGGFAPDIPRVFGGSRESKFAEFGFQYSRRIAHSENVALHYTIDAIPLAILNYEQERLIQVTPTTTAINRNGTTAYGFGVTPVGFKLNFLRKKKIQPFLTAQAGILVFNKSIPDDRSPLRPNERGRRFNFTLAGGGGVEFLTDNARSYTIGFKFHHISNSSTGNINPGYDQNLFYFGYTFKKW